MTRYAIGLTIAMTLATTAGCSSEQSTDTSAVVDRQPSEAGAKYLLSSAPADPQDVIPMREDADDEEEVVVVGRIGGSVHPWVDGLAAFSIVDRSLSACTDIPGDQCPTPWDYCCATDRLPAATTLVKVVDEQGNIVPTGAQQLLGLNELQTVVVKGTAQKDDAGNVTILARSIYVDRTNPGQVQRGETDADHGHAHDHDHGHDHAAADDDDAGHPDDHADDDVSREASPSATSDADRP